MAGRGPAPKPAASRARTNSDPLGVRVVKSEPTPAPELPELMPGGQPWPRETLTWWRNWVADPLTAEFRTADWDELLISAVLHGRFWSGDTKVAGELRLRTSKFGATPEDRARLRITYGAADDADDKAARRRARTDEGPVAKGRYSKLRAVE
jgi:hypothetical protein